MTGRGERDGKVEALTASRTLNPRPDSVTDPTFVVGGFFDARDLLQVKYGPSDLSVGGFGASWSGC
jgi:hypothetical protein